MRTIYQGVDLMGLMTCHEANLEPVYDDSRTDYLYSRFTLLDEFIINPQISGIHAGALPVTPEPASYARSSEITTDLRAKPPGVGGTGVGTRPRTPPPFVGGPFPPPAVGTDLGFASNGLVKIVRAANAPALTHRDIRQRLTTNRGKLHVFDGPGMETGFPLAGDGNEPAGPLVRILLSTPAPGMLCDCNNGPKPRLFNIRQDEGDGGLFVALWGVEAFINETDENGMAPSSALLSNRFRQTHKVDTFGWSTVRSEGIARFRSDLIYSVQVSPDSLRASLFLPIPLGFEREIEYVEGDEAAVAIRYAYIDTQKKTNFVAGPFVNPDKPGTGASEIAIFHRQSVTTSSDVLGGAMSAYERILGIKANRAIDKSVPKTPGGAPKLPSRVGGPGRPPRISPPPAAPAPPKP